MEGLLAGVEPDRFAEVLAGAEAAARAQFPDEDVLTVLRRVLSGG
ncbi:hypothetical protein GCM10010211_10610 [Streptomyces albospinus]|uniref:Uncharacterized protein n=1 Tax=Streptomyces albospinus TaxID=285515 RepID=A0ABQ2UQK6_9ACTN|nr:hypothetical protein [Streptomyces albospinus]GGU48278.1 hypothetical protein GCM10010211_10610 [Streptomyces albospinus]